MDVEEDSFVRKSACRWVHLVRPFIAETAADRMAGGAGSPVTPTFLAGSGVYFPVATQRTQRSPFLTVPMSAATSIPLRTTLKSSLSIAIEGPVGARHGHGLANRRP